ncbi:MAG: EAL domain-containing protein [Dehalococcoidia bacterium]
MEFPIASTSASREVTRGDAAASARRRPPAWVLYLLVGAAVCLAAYGGPASIRESALLNSAVYEGIGLSSVAVTIFAVATGRARPVLPWCIFALGNLLFVTGDVIFSYYELILDIEAPFPSSADLFYIAGYPVMAFGLLRFFRQRNHAQAGVVVDALIVTASAAFVVWIYLMAPYATSDDISLLEKVISISYPLGDLLLLAFVAPLLLSGRSRNAACWLVAAGASLELLTDGAYTRLLLEDAYYSGHVIDTGWLFAYLLWGAAALHPAASYVGNADSAQQPTAGKSRVLLLGAVCLLGPGVVVVEALRGGQIDPPLFAGASAVLFLLVLARMWSLMGHLSALQAMRRDERFRSLVQNATDLTAILDEDGRITYASPSLERFTGQDAEDLLGIDIFSLLTADDAERLRPALHEMRLEAGAVVPTECSLRQADGSYRHLEVIASNLLQDGSVGGVVVNGRDITDRKLAEVELERKAFYDTLTGLPNRELLLQRLEETIAAGPDQEDCAVLFLDIDRFKIVNDSLGHAAGDQLLVQVGEALREYVCDADMVARLSGDEFVVLAKNLPDKGSAWELGERLLRRLRIPFPLERRELVISASAGISFCSSGKAATDVLREADIALHRAKAAGKDRWVVYDHAMDAGALWQLDMERDLRLAVESSSIEVAYQPQVELATGRVVGVEALARWNTPTGCVPPSEFIPLAEESGLILPLGLCVLDKACRQVKAWRTELALQESFVLSVNLSVKQLEHSDHTEDVVSVLKRSGLDLRFVRLEITESVMAEEGGPVAENIATLRALGVQLAIDDFGTGYASLTYLCRLAVDVVKIDRSFVAGVDNEVNQASIVRAIISLAGALGIEVVAEGIETQEELDFLVSIGCGQGQGFLYARPDVAARIGPTLSGRLPLPAPPRLNRRRPGSNVVPFPLQITAPPDADVAI